MEDQSPQNSSAEQASARSANALRELEQRAHAAITSKRDQVSRLEADITRQIEEITVALQAQAADEAHETADADRARAENEQLIHNLAESRAGWESERATLIAERDELAANRDVLEEQQNATEREFARAIADWQSEHTALTDRLDKLQADLASSEERQQESDKCRIEWELERGALESQRDELAARLASIQSQQHTAHQALTESQSTLEAELTATSAERDTLAKRIAAIESEFDAARQEFVTARESHNTERTSLMGERDELASQLAGLKSQQQASSGQIDEVRATWEAERAALNTQRDELAAQVAALESHQHADKQQFDEARATWESERAALAARYDDLTSQVAAIETQQQPAQLELAESTAAWETERIALVAERDELASQVAALESRQHAAQDEWRNQLLDFEARLREQQASWDEQRTEWSETCSQLEQERDELQQKFELALQDLQRFRGRIAELEQELARRPETNQVDSTELVALRAERDDLSRRVEELEHRPAAPVDANAEQHLSDLQRRFEMAVDDVRELKTKNAKLESELAAGGGRSAAVPAVGGGMDWESQKRRLLAALEGEAEPHGDPVREKERATIQGTIDMTDAVIAEKDREIADLKVELATASASATPSDAERDQKINELVDADEVVAEHRKKVGQLEREMEGKLRAAELELSIERAKMARQKADLEELKSDLEMQRQAFEANGGAASGAPRRKWLSKLGLSGEEKE